jgi:toxin ParE1/3/4
VDANGSRPQKKMADRYRIRPRADIDLDSIWFFIAADNRKAADAMIDRIIDTFDVLATMPFTGRPRPEFGDNLRSMAVGNYVVFYVPLPGGIEVVRVMNGRQDIGADDMA